MQPEKISRIIMRSMKKLFATRKGKKIHTGFRTIDNALDGFQSGDFIIVGGRPGMGKTSFAIAVASNIVRKYKIPVGFFSFQCTKEELTLRFLTHEARLDRSTTLKHIGKTAKTLWGWELYIDDTIGMNVEQFIKKVRQLRDRKRIELAIVDDLQCFLGAIAFDTCERKVMMHICKEIKKVAQQINIPIILTSRLPSLIEKREEQYPQLADIPFHIYANKVLFLRRPRMYDRFIKKYKDGSEPFELIIAEPWIDGSSIIELKFYEKFGRFEEKEQKN